MIILFEASNPQGTDVGNIINVRLPLQPNYTRKKVKTKSLTMGQQLAIKDRVKNLGINQKPANTWFLYRFTSKKSLFDQPKSAMRQFRPGVK